VPGARPIAKACGALPGENPVLRNRLSSGVPLRMVNVMVRRIGQVGAASQAALAAAAVGAFITLAACGSQVTVAQPASADGPGAAPTPGGAAVAAVALCRNIPQLTSVVVTRTMAFRAPQNGPIMPRGISIMEPGLVRGLAAALCGLPKMPPGLMTCAAGSGSSVRFGFAAGGRGFPPVTVQAGGCLVVTGLGSARTASSAAFWGTLSADLAGSSSPSTSRSAGISP